MLNSVRSRKARARLVLAFAISAFLVSCSYQAGVRDGQNLLRNNKPQEAAKKFKEKAEKEGNDQIVYLFEYGTALQLAGDYRESTKVFLKAEDLTDIKDYHSLTRITGSMLLNAGMVQYKGEDYEKVLVNAFLAINFLLEGDLEAAGVETRKINEKLYRYRFEAKKNYEQNPFASYLAAMIWEQQKNWDSAYIDYKKSYEVNPSVEYLKQDLIRAAKRAQRDDDLAKWRREFKGVKDRPEWTDKSFGEVVLVYQQGWGPKKMPHPDFTKVPKLYPVPSDTKTAKLVIDGVGEELSQAVYSVQDVAIKVLDDAYAGIIASRVAGVAVKAVVADQLRQKNELLGDLAWIGMNLVDQADLRHWSTLPESFQVARVYVKQGQYKARAVGLNWSQLPTGEVSNDFTIDVKPGKKTFIAWRSLQ